MVVTDITSNSKLDGVDNADEFVKEINNSIYRYLIGKYDTYLLQKGYIGSAIIENEDTLPTGFFKVKDVVIVFGSDFIKPKYIELCRVDKLSSELGYYIEGGKIYFNNFDNVRTPYTVQLEYYVKEKTPELVLDEGLARLYVDGAYQTYLHDCREDSDTEAIVFINQYIQNMYKELKKELGKNEVCADGIEYNFCPRYA